MELTFSDKYYRLTGVRTFLETAEGISKEKAHQLIWGIPIKNFDIKNKARYDLLVEVIGEIVKGCGEDAEELFMADNVITRAEAAYLESVNNDEEQEIENPEGETKE